MKTKLVSNNCYLLLISLNNSYIVNSNLLAMRQNYFLLLSIMLLLLTGCKDDNGMSYPESTAPEIVVKRNELYSVPNRKFIIKADLKDDLGLKSLKISIPEFNLDKDIVFPTDSLMKEYKLAYTFLAPSDTKATDTFKVNLLLTDVSDNNVSKELTLHLNGDFNPPVISNIKPTDGTVFFLADDMKMNISFDVSDVTGIDSVEVIADELGIHEKVKVDGSRAYTFSQIYSIPSKLGSYEITISALDNFVESNKTIQKVKFSVANGLDELYLADVPTNTDLTADVFGVPMYYHKKKDGVFTFKYYADRDNKEIYFLGQETSFEPHCFGASSEGKLEKSIAAHPIVLPTKGYYEILVDIAAMTYTATRYTPSSPVYNPAQITICGNGMKYGGWDPSNTDLLLAANPDNPYQIGRSLILTGSEVAMTITSPAWASPWWRLEAKGTIVFLGGGNPTYQAKAGNYKFVMDTELERATLVKE